MPGYLIGYRLEGGDFVSYVGSSVNLGRAVSALHSEVVREFRTLGEDHEFRHGDEPLPIENRISNNRDRMIGAVRNQRIVSQEDPITNHIRRAMSDFAMRDVNLSDISSWDELIYAPIPSFVLRMQTPMFPRYAPGLSSAPNVSYGFLLDLDELNIEIYEEGRVFNEPHEGRYALHANGMNLIRTIPIRKLYDRNYDPMGPLVLRTGVEYRALAA